MTGTTQPCISDNTSSLKTQWIQLLGLSFAHMCIDMIPGAVNVVMPAFQEKFAFSIMIGITLISILNIVCNFVQVLIGHTRADKKNMLLLPIGIMLIGAFCFVAFLPRQPYSAWLMIPLLLISAVAVAITHPEALRALHTIDKIPPSLCSSIFLTSGYMGFAGGGLIASVLIYQFDLNGLLLMLVFPVLALASIYIRKQHLAIDKGNEKANHKIEQVNFILIMLMAIPATTAATVLCAMIPQRIAQLGLPLTFGGISVTLLVAGSAVGAFFWSYLAHKKGELFAIAIALASGIPFLFGYLFMMENKFAVVLLFLAGLGSGSAYPLLVTLARYATGSNLGRRMGFIVGGTWGIASLILWLMGPIADKFGIIPVLMTTPMFYLTSLGIGLGLLQQNKTRSKGYTK